MARAPAKALARTSEGTRLSSGNFPAPLLSETAIGTTSDRDFTRPLFTTSEIVDARFSDVVLTPVKTLDAASSTAVPPAEQPRAQAKRLQTPSEGTMLASGNLPAPLLTEAVIAKTRFSDVVLTPVKSLDTASEMVGASVSERTPVKSLAIASDTVGLSANPLSPAKSLLAASEIGGASDRDFTRPLFTMPAIAETRFSDVLRTPVKALVTLSDIADNELSEMARAPAKTLPTTSEGTRLASGNFPAPLLTESAIETTSDRDFARPLFTTSEIVDARFSDVVLTPVKTLPTASEGATLSSASLPTPLLTESAIETTSDWEARKPLPTASEIVDARFSDVVLNPVKTLDAASDMVGVSDSVLSALYTLPARSEGATASERKLKVPLLTVSDIREARFSETPLAPLKTLATESATVGLSVSVLNPAKTLPMTSEGTTLSGANLSTPLFTESAIAETRLSVSPLNPVKALDTASEMVGASVSERTPVKSLASVSDTVGLSVSPLNPVKSLEAISEMVGVSVRLLNPVKSLSVTSDNAGVSKTNFPADLLMLSVTSPARLAVSPLNPVKTLVIVSDTVGISASALNPVKSLTMASERGGVSESVLNPWKSLVLESETTGLSPGGALSPWKSFPCESEIVGLSGSEYEYRNPGVPTSLAAVTVVSRTVSPEAPATVTWSQYSTTRNWMLLNGPIVPVT